MARTKSKTELFGKHPLRKYDREIQKHFAVKIRKLKESPDIHGKT